MENLSVTGLRDLAREAMLASGAKGFMRFAAQGPALLATDAATRCEDGGAALCRALEAAGFVCRTQGTLVHITPGDALLMRLCEGDGCICPIDWGSPLHPAQALAVRLMREAELPLTQSGRTLVLETARLCWQPQQKVLEGLLPLRAQIARMMREKERSGFALAGRLLVNWTNEQMKGDDAR